MNWIYLSLAIVSEVIGTLLIRTSEGFSRIIPTLFVFGFYVLSYYFFNLTIKKMEISIAYAIWSGLGTAILVAIGIVFFNEHLTLPRILALAMIIAGVILLHATTTTSEV
ncbi:MAG: DMT family transporter [Cytophagaceae bacterium]